MTEHVVSKKHKFVAFGAQRDVVALLHPKAQNCSNLSRSHIDCVLRFGT